MSQDYTYYRLVCFCINILVWTVRAIDVHENWWKVRFPPQLHSWCIKCFIWNAKTRYVYVTDVYARGVNVNLTPLTSKRARSSTDARGCSLWRSLLARPPPAWESRVRDPPALESRVRDLLGELVRTRVGGVTLVPWPGREWGSGGWM